MPSMPTKISRFCEGLMEAGWLAALLLAPLFFNVYSARIFEPDKIALIRSIALVVLAAWLVKLIAQRGFYWDRIQPDEPVWKWLLKFPLVGWVMALIVVYLVATLFSVTVRVSLLGSYQRLQGAYTMFSYLVIFTAILTNLRRKTQAERIVTIAILSSLPMVLYGFLQRYDLDPVPWGGDTQIRIASTAGNSIFVGAYLIMVFPLTAMRLVQSFQDILKGVSKNSLAIAIVRGTLYTFLFIVQIIALYMTGSRGPVLGWLTGGVFLLLLLAYIYQKRWMTAGFLGLGAAILIFLIIFQIPGGPLEALRKSPAVGRFGNIINAESNSAKVRRYIWEGAANLVQPHQPLYFPDGSTDAFNAIRPLIGYGPESMYVAYNQFYVPALGQVERRNASPDRSHNETWDWLVQTGVLGGVVYVGLFLGLFYYAMKFLGLVQTSRQRWLFLALTGAGGLIGAVGLALWSEVAYFGVGLPLGITAGLGVYIAYVSLFGPRRDPVGPNEQARLFLLAALLAAVVSHYVEINFGIAILATRTYFWTFTALILAVGYLLPKHGEYGDVTEGPSAAAAVTNDEQNAKARKKSARISARPSQAGADWQKNALVYGALLGLALMSMGYGFILNKNYTNAIQIWWNALTHITVNQALVPSYGLLGIFVMTILFGGLLLIVESIKAEAHPNWLRAARSVFAASLIPAALFWLIHAGQLALIEASKPSNYEGMITQIDRLGGLMTNFYFFGLLVMAGIAFVLRLPALAKKTSQLVPALSAGLVGLAALLLILFTNLRIIHADVTFKMAEPFNRATQWQTATAIYKYANQQAPNEDHYFLFLARSYMEQAKEVTEPSQVFTLVETTELDLKHAQEINPLNTDHTANLARLYTWFAGKNTDPEARAGYAQTAYEYYQTALKLSPQNSTLWGECSSLLLRLMNKPDEAYEMLQHALSLDEKYALTQGLVGDYWNSRSQGEDDETLKAEYLANAAERYMLGASLARKDEKANKLEYLKRAGNIYVQLNRLEDAAKAYDLLAKAGPAEADKWLIQETLAKVYYQLGDKEQALTHAETALELAADDKKAEVQTLIDQINAMP